MSAVLIPPGGTWFDTHRTSFTNVPINPGDQGIDTSKFLEAAEATTTLFDLLGSVAFTPVKNDMVGNIKKIRDRQLVSPSTSETLQALVRSELSTRSHTATEGLLWLTRGLDFTAQALRHDLTKNASTPVGAPKPTQELADCFRAGYKTTLAPHHSFLIKPIFSAAMSATPYRKDFYSKMVNGQTGSEEKARQAMEQWVAALEQRVGILKAFLASKEAKW